MSSDRGRVRVRVPCPDALSTVTLPMRLHISCTIDKPHPVPPGFVVYNGSKCHIPSDSYGNAVPGCFHAGRVQAVPAWTI